MTTPKYSDVCAWCMDAYGFHRGTKCDDRFGTRFRQIGDLLLREVPVGSSIRYYTDGEDVLIHKAANTAKAIVCFHLTSDCSTLLGWSSFYDSPRNGKWFRSDAPNTISASRLDPRCDSGLWISDNASIHNVVSMGKGTTAMAVASPVSSGMKCAVKVCGTFNNYAEPNQPDGSHICFSCRESGRKA